MGCDFFKFINIIDDFLFQSTHPSWGATNRFKHILPFETISIHAPIVGCDFESPREKTRYLISIHAPIVGCDNLYSSSPIFQIIFQSTHPSWGATKNVLRYSFTNNNFNPRTHRGVRPLMLRIFLGLNRISIHAPIVGCDAEEFSKLSNSANFNPRTHRGVRRRYIVDFDSDFDISIHAPIVGCDFCDCLLRFFKSISIHAPIVGCDKL